MSLELNDFLMIIRRCGFIKDTIRLFLNVTNCINVCMFSAEQSTVSVG